MKHTLITIVVHKYIQNENDLQECEKLLKILNKGAFSNRLNVEDVKCSIAYIRFESGTKYEKVDDI